MVVASVPITSFYAGVSGLIYFFLSVRVSQQRRRLKVAIGDGTIEIMRQLQAKSGDERELLKKYSPLAKAIRTHGNFYEFTPFVLLLLGFLELNGATVRLLHGLPLVLLFGRLLHAVGLSRSPLLQVKVAGVILTYGILFSTSLASIYYGIKGW